MALTNYEVWTLQDLIDHVLDVYVSTGDSPKNRRSATRAVIDAYHELGSYRKWTYLYRRFPISTVAQQVAGSIEYTHATRTVTLAGATFPADAIWFEIMVNRVRFEIERFVDATHVVLSERANPGADLAAGTAYTLYRDRYPLPDDFEDMRNLIDIQSPGSSPRPATTDEVLIQSRIVNLTSMPQFYALTRGVLAGGLAIQFGPSPSEARSYDAVGKFRPTALKVEKYTTGTVSLTSGSTSVTSGGSAAFTADHVGCLLRVASDAVNLPTSIVGSLDDITNKAVFEAVVTRVPTGTTLEIDRAPSDNLATRKYVLSSRLDIESASMLSALQRLTEAKYALLDNREDFVKRARMAEIELGKAAAADDRAPADSPGYYGPMRLPDLVSSVTY